MSSSMRSAESRDVARDGIVYQEDVIASPLVRKLLAVARIIIGFFFLWPFLDKLFGLGYGTPVGKGWLAGTAPAQGFIDRIENPLGAILKPIFSNPFGDVLFMFALFGIGVAMIMGAGLRIAGIGGTILVALMWLSELPFVQTHMANGQLVRGATNPILDDHWLEALILLLCAAGLAGDTWGVGKLWARITHGNKFLR
ncbi:hypothetical protein [Nigerium massiliense]|uniref:hypothetical protein n=1 Tax=Nigerium massiliense TaxID=1522317 RepID=UPI000694E952|nr:hypothetical protein [Nigerium massiliense]